MLDAAPKPSGLDNLADPALPIAAFAVAFIASAETLLSAAAVDRMHSGQRSVRSRTVGKESATRSADCLAHCR